MPIFKSDLQERLLSEFCRVVDLWFAPRKIIRILAAREKKKKCRAGVWETDLPLRNPAGEDRDARDYYALNTAIIRLEARNEKSRSAVSTTLALARSARDDVSRSTFTLRGEASNANMYELGRWSISREVIGPRPVLPAGLYIAARTYMYVRGHELLSLLPRLQNSPRGIADAHSTFRRCLFCAS